MISSKLVPIIISLLFYSAVIFPTQQSPTRICETLMTALSKTVKRTAIGDTLDSLLKRSKVLIASGQRGKLYIKPRYLHLRFPHLQSFHRESSWNLVKKVPPQAGEMVKDYLLRILARKETTEKTMVNLMRHLKEKDELLYIMLLAELQISDKRTFEKYIKLARERNTPSMFDKLGLILQGLRELKDAKLSIARELEQIDSIVENLNALGKTVKNMSGILRRHPWRTFAFGTITGLVTGMISIAIMAHWSDEAEKINEIERGMKELKLICLQLNEALKQQQVQVAKDEIPEVKKSVDTLEEKKLSMTEEILKQTLSLAPDI